MATRWFRREDGREVGPLSFQTLVAMVREGILKEDDRVRMEHQRKSIAVRDVLGLMQAAQRARPRGKNEAGHVVPDGDVPLAAAYAAETEQPR